MVSISDIQVSDIQVVRTLLDYVNEIPNLPCNIELEYLGGEPPAMMLQQLSGASKYDVDILGNYSAQFPFALYVRTWGTTENDRVDAITILNDIGLYFDKQTLNETLPEMDNGKKSISITMTALPSLVSRNDNGVEDYQAVYRFDYQQNYE